MTGEPKKELRERYYEERRERERRKAKTEEQTKLTKAPVSQNPVIQPKISESTERTQVQKAQKESIKIPTLNLERPVISFKTTPLTVDYPKEKGERHLIVPKFKVVFPTFEFSRLKLDTSFSIERKIRPLVVPKIRLLKPTVQFSEGELDVDYPISRREREVFIPEFIIQKSSMSFDTSPLNTEVLTFQPSNQQAQPTAQAQIEDVEEVNEELTEPSRQEETTEIIQVPVETQGRSEKETSGEELQDPLEFLFGGGAGKIRDLEPLVILFKDHKDDSYIQTLETLLLRIYREKHGGYPDVKKLTLREDWNRREIEQWLDEGKLFLIDLDKGEKTTEVKLSPDMLADRLWAIFSKRKGIVIFYTKDEEVFREYGELLEDIKWNKLQLRAEIVKITPRKLSSEEKLKLADLLFGFVSIEEVPPSASMDAVLNASEREYEKKLKNLEDKYYTILGIVNPRENESIEHLRGKAFIVHWLIKRLEEKGMIPKEDKKKDWKFIRDSIKTEEPKNGAVVDVCFGDENYEFETLFEEGLGKIHKTLRKYEQSQANVGIVVEPITAFLHAKEFAGLMKIVKQIYPALNVKLHTLDVKNEELVPLEKYIREVKKAVGPSS